MFNKATNQYEVRKVFKRTGHEFVGTSKVSNDEAKADLKRQLAALNVPNPIPGGKPFRILPLVPTGEVVASPGKAQWVDDKGRKHIGHRPDRVAQVYARPDLAAMLRKQNGLPEWKAEEKKEETKDVPAEKNA